MPEEMKSKSPRLLTLSRVLNYIVTFQEFPFVECHNFKTNLHLNHNSGVDYFKLIDTCK
jgi:hypothetical protein